MLNWAMTCPLWRITARSCGRPFILTISALNFLAIFSASSFVMILAMAGSLSNELLQDSELAAGTRAGFTFGLLRKILKDSKHYILEAGNHVGFVASRRIDVGLEERSQILILGSLHHN